MKRKHLRSRHLKKTFNLYLDWFVKHIQTPIGITIVVGFILIIIISVLDIRYLETSNGRDILIEAHGLLFDIFVFGVLLAYLNKFLEKKQRSERYKEEIDDFRGWEEKEAKYRIVGNIKRLNKLGFGRINLANCYLEGADLHSANLVKSNLRNVDLSGANLVYADLSYADLSNANLSGANLTHALLRGANLTNAKLIGCQMDYTSLWRALLIEADISKASLKNTNLLEADLSRVKHEDTDFSKVNIDLAIADTSLKKAVTEKQMTE